MKNIYLLPTGESRLSLNRSYRDFSVGTEAGEPYWIYSDYKHFHSVTDSSVRPHHMYITNDEQIKEGDWRYDIELNRIEKGKETGTFKNWKKIILTTDPKLIEDGIQSIPDEFLEWFVKNPSCDKVVVTPYLKDIINSLTNEKYPVIQHRHFDETKMIFRYHYKIINPKTTQEIIDEDFSGGLDLGQIIPKEEPKFEESTDTTVDIMLLANSMFGKKEETIEEVAFRLYPIDMRECDNSEDWDINEQYRNEWIAGAKWMKEQYRIKDLRK